MKISSRVKHLFYIILLFLMCAATYSCSLENGFLFEDKDLIVDNPSIKSPRHLIRLVTSDMYELAYEGARPNYYRPVETISFMLDYKLWKLNPLGYHLINVLVHFLNSVLAYVIVYLLFSNPFIAIVSSMLFCIHPINVAAVVFITGRSDLFAALFMLSAFLCAILLFRSRGNKRVYHALIILCSLLALLSRENSVFIFFGIALLSFFVEGEKKDKINCLLLVGSTVALYLCFRIWFLHIPLARHEFLPMSIPLKAINFLHISISYIFLMAVPVNLYLMHVTSPIIGLADARLWLAVGGMVIICIGAYIQRRDKRLIFGIAWFGIFVSQAYFLMAGFYGGKICMFEHWVYFASLGCYVAVGTVIYRGKKFFRAALYPLMAVVFLIYSNLARVNCSNYKDSFILSKRILRFDPENKEAHKELVGIYLARKQYSDAFSHINKALKLAPLDPDLYLLIGAYYEDIGNIESALAAYAKLLTIEPRSARANNNLGAIYFNKADFSQAKLFFQRAIKLNPLLYEPYMNLAKLCVKNNEINAAVFFYEQAVKLNPNVSEGLINLAQLYLGQRDFSGAINILNDALAAGHKDAVVSALLGIAYGESGFEAKAQYYFREALALSPSSADALLNIGVFYANHNQPDRAIAVWQKALESNPDNKIIQGHIDRAKELLRAGETNITR